MESLEKRVEQALQDESLNKSIKLVLRIKEELSSIAFTKERDEEIREQTTNTLLVLSDKGSMRYTREDCLSKYIAYTNAVIEILG
ncbi:MAG: hypothetical protein ACPG5V_00760 [Vibrio cyclitrophicus]